MIFMDFKADKMKRCLITGASGFVGGAVLRGLIEAGTYDVRAAVRRNFGGAQLCPDLAVIGEINKYTNWKDALKSVDIVVHCAARVHVMSVGAAEVFDEVNFYGTLELARQAALSGVRRFIFISSIKVNGERTDQFSAFSSDSIPAPSDAYARSKLRAELGLRELSKETGMEVVIIRPPLVYGPGVGANFLTMMRWLKKGVPLPFGGINNRRSLVSIDNLVDLILRSLDHPAAVGKVFLVSDDEDMSTPTLLSRLGIALDCPVRLVSVPTAWLIAGASLLGRRDMSGRLLDSLYVDIEYTKNTLDWTPPYKVQDSLNETARFFIKQSVT